MQIQFRLSWLKSGAHVRKAFKSENAYSLFNEYVGRISKFTPCKIGGAVSKNEVGKLGIEIWVCDKGGTSVSSEILAKSLQKVMDQGVRELQIVIGGPDGFTKREVEELKPNLKWSFGPLTLPHELAAVIASEQIYRAWTILKRTPYHLGH